MEEREEKERDEIKGIPDGNIRVEDAVFTSYGSGKSYEFAGMG